MTFWHGLLAMVAKDARLEWRSKETIAAMCLVAVLVLLVFVFALDPARAHGPDTAVGVLWAAMVFGAAIGLGRTFGREREDGRLAAMMLAPVDRSAIFVAKWIGFVILLLVMAAVVLPVFRGFFDVPLNGALWRWTLLVALVAMGIAGAGVCLAAVTALTRAPDILLPVVLFPLLVPLLLGAVSVSADLMASGRWDETGHWLRLMAAYDILFLAAPTLLFEYVVEV